MPRTQKRWQADQPFVDGQIFMSFGAGDVLSGSGAVGARSAAGKISLSLPTAATAYIMDRALSFALFRTGMQDDLQEYLGGGVVSGSPGTFASAQGLAAPPNTFTTPAGASGPPPFTGVTQFTTPSSRPKGLQINTVTPIYTIGSANATVNHIAVYENLFTNGSAPTQNTVLASTNLTLTAATNPYVTAVTLASPAFITDVNNDVVVEWAITTGASTGTATVYGVVFGVSCNYN